MNAAQAQALAEAIADALDRAGIVVERASRSRGGNVHSYDRMGSFAVAARTIGTWLSWGWVPSRMHMPNAPPPSVAPAPDASPPSHLRLVGPEVSNDAEGDDA